MSHKVENITQADNSKSNVIDLNVRIQGMVILQIVSILLFIISSGCKKLVEVPPESHSLSQDNIFSTDESAISVLNGFYVELSSSGSGGVTGSQGLSVRLGLSADELALQSTSITSFVHYYSNDLNSISSGTEAWPVMYKYILKANLAIEGLEKASALTEAVKDQLIGEAKFLRAFFYFYLTNLYGELPLALSSDWKSNSLLARSSVADVYEQIIKDLTQAKLLLSDVYYNGKLSGSSSDRTRPNKSTASALLARVYLYAKEYSKAESEASHTLTNTATYGLPGLDSTFLRFSREAIWQIQPTKINFNTEDGITFIIPSLGFSSSNPVSLSPQLLSIFSSVDKRGINGKWINSRILSGQTYYFPFKYKIGGPANSNTNSLDSLKEFLVILRLGEQYLIRSEARIHLNNLSGAIDDLDKIRDRAGLARIAVVNPGISSSALMDSVMLERQRELFTEQGHRWFDLKRSDRIDVAMSVITPIKSLNLVFWEPFRQLFPIPLSELNKAPNLVQNPGYN